MDKNELQQSAMERAEESERWSTWTLRGLLGLLAVTALGVWNDVHDMKSDLRAHIAAEDKVNGFQDFRLEKHAESVASNKADVAKIDGRLKVAEFKLGIH